MPLDLLNVTGTIRVNPLVDGSVPLDSGDETLETLFACLAHQYALTASEAPDKTSCLVAHSRFSGSSAGHRSIRADLGQLLADLQAEYDRLDVAS